MKLQISSKELQRALSVVSKIIRSKNSMPVLDNAMLHEKDGKYLLTASDVENELAIAVDLMLMEGKFTPVCINPKVILPALSSLPEQPLNIEISEDGHYTTKVEYLGGSFNIVSLPANEFPMISGVNANEALVSFDINTNVLIPCIRGANMSTAADELRPIMGCVCMDVKPDGVIFVGSDGHKLYKYAHTPGAPFGNGTGPVLVHTSVVSAIENAFKGDVDVHVVCNGKFAEFSSADVRFVSRQLDTRYPNYESVIPTKPAYHAIVNTKSLLNTIKRVGLFASDSSRMIRLQYDGTALVLSAEDIDFSTSSKETLDVIDTNLPADFSIGFKDNTLIQHLSVISTDNVRLCLDDPSRPVLIKNDDVNSPLTLLMMPMLLNT